ncbi:hypothetical protein L1987_84701 [Smallanthus sonchifolius]|uniref:Uncharacterized protein n=1 Tax=Smallanthus sonchifolius TaxID=185202 RepID=A0ACB8XUF8_9ASTR|nr:hypothetical protein L1987_84701 [Smallanthus sonchifolius]
MDHDEDCLALFEFKQTIFHQNSDAAGFQKFDSWRKVKSNISDSDCCLSDGVVCSYTGHVIGLDWSGSSLNGVINSSSTLFKLVHLQMLNLSMNNFVESQIPSEIARLKQLRSLDLSYSGFNCQIPNEISHLIQLSSLDLSWNPLKLQSPGLAYLLQKMTRLENLFLSGVDVSSSVPHFLANFSSLRSIELIDCQLQDEFPSAIFHLPKLKYLHMRNNSNLTGSLPEFHNNTLLKHLNLFSTGFAGIIPESVSNLNHLEVLSLGRCNFSGHIPGSLPNLTHLTILSLYKNEFIGLVPSLGQISSSFLNFKSLELLAISFNKFSGKVGLDSFLGLNKLKVLDLAYNRLSFVTTTNYTNATLPEMNFLALSSCNLKEFPVFLGFQLKLTNLFVDYNEIEGLVPNWIWNNSQETIQVITLRENFITGFHQHPRFLPWIRLEEFDVAYNQLQGQLPIPQPSIVVYDVSNNNLTGKIPSLICEMKSLRFLDLSSNKMTGSLPPCLENLSNSLSALILKRNNFHGPVMNKCTHGSLLERIDLSENRFTGLVSKSLADCTNLEFLSLADNSFEDVFPVWFETLPSLQVLILRSNKFYGAIEGLSTNSSQFPIDLSSNKFEGQIPLSLHDLHGLESLNLSNNHFTGSILPSLGNLKNLESLDLSQNELSGKIPQQLLQLGFLAILNVSFNHLNGQIPQGKQFDTFENNSYLGNLGLCGKPLSKECKNSKVLMALPPTSSNEYQSLMPSDIIDWMVILLGVGSGLAIGIVNGSFLYARFGDWLLDRLGMKDKWVRPLRNTRRN